MKNWNPFFIRNAGEKFIELLKHGPSVGIYLVMASTWSFRKMSGQLLKYIPIRCAEMVVSGEEFIYYKADPTVEYLRLYPSRPVKSTISLIPTDANVEPFRS